mgnify:CR=1 FL=1
MSTTKYDHLPEQEKHAALAREEAAIKAEALRYHDKHRMTPAKVAKLTARHVVLALLAAFWLIPILWLVVTSFGVDKGPNLSPFFPKAYTLAITWRCFSPTRATSSRSGCSTRSSLPASPA